MKVGQTMMRSQLDAIHQGSIFDALLGFVLIRCGLPSKAHSHLRCDSLYWALFHVSVSLTPWTHLETPWRCAGGKGSKGSSKFSNIFQVTHLQPRQNPRRTESEMQSKDVKTRAVFAIRHNISKLGLANFEVRTELIT